MLESRTVARRVARIVVGRSVSANQTDYHHGDGRRGLLRRSMEPCMDGGGCDPDDRPVGNSIVGSRVAPASVGHLRWFSLCSGFAPNCAQRTPCYSAYDDLYH